MVFNEENSDDSSSEDETIKEALKEAADSQFLKKSLFGANDDNNAEEKEQHAREENTEKFDEFGVSEGFKDFVSKKLTELLDRNIEMIEDNKTKKRKKSRKNKTEPEDLGIKLLRTSTSLLSKVVEEDHSKSQPTRRLMNNSEIEDNKSKCKEAAVDPEWILSKEETKFWSNRTKGTLFEYKKMPDGSLVEK